MVNDSNHKQRLGSWKAIARHLGCSERTARRWESNEGLPVHRQMHQSQATVYAYAEELDAWQQRGESPLPKTLRDPADASLAVLPLEFLGQDPAQSYLADGMAEEIITRLSRLPMLRVISRTSSRTLRGTTLDARSIARKLQVSRLLEGSVQLAGSRLKISLRLVDPETETTLWTEQFSGASEALFDIQDAIASQVAGALSLQLNSKDKSRLSQSAAPSVEIWRYLQQARDSALRWRRDSIDRAIEWLHQGLEEHPGQVDLLAALGRTQLQYREAGLDMTEQPMQEARLAVQRLQDAGATGPSFHLLKGWVHYLDANLQAAVGDLSKALADAPGDPDTLGLLINCLLLSGQQEGARPMIDRLVATDPLTPLNVCLPGWAAVLAGNNKAAIAPYRAMFDMDPGNPMARAFLVWVLAINRRFPEARDLCAPMANEQQGHPATHLTRLFGQVLRGAGGEQVMHEIPQNLLHAAQGSEMFSRLLGELGLLANDTAEAERWFRSAMERGFINAPYLAGHALRTDQEDAQSPLVKLIREMQQRMDAFRWPISPDQD